MAHARKGYISTSGLKSEITIVFLDPDFFSGAGISALYCVFLSNNITSRALFSWCATCYSRHSNDSSLFWSVSPFCLHCESKK